MNNCGRIADIGAPLPQEAFRRRPSGAGRDPGLDLKTMGKRLDLARPSLRFRVRVLLLANLLCATTGSQASACNYSLSTLEIELHGAGAMGPTADW